MYCPYCGGENKGDSSFCGLCGKNISLNRNNSNIKDNILSSLKDNISDKNFKDVANFSNSSKELNSNELKTGCYERGMQIVPDSIISDDGEKPVKQYNVAILRSRLKFARAEGRLQVTNKRLLFRATGRSIMGRTALQHEFAISEIAGLELRKDHRFGFFELILGGMLIYFILFIIVYILMAVATKTIGFSIFLAILFGLIGWGTFILLDKKLFLRSIFSGIATASFGFLYIPSKDPFLNGFVHFLGVIAGLCALISFILFIISFFKFCFVPNLVIDIKTKGGTAPVQIRRKTRSIYKSSSEEYTGFREVIPAEDTDQAIKEIGALISDVQKLGDIGVEKWINKKGN